MGRFSDLTRNLFSPDQHSRDDLERQAEQELRGSAPGAPAARFDPPYNPPPAAPPPAPPPGRPGGFDGHDQPASSGYGEPASSGYGEPASSGYGQPASSGYGQPASSGYGQPASSGYGQPASSGYGQPASSGYGQPAGGLGDGPALGGPAPSAPLTPEEEREAVTRMALDDLSSRGSAGLGIRPDASMAEMMRDQALQEHLERGERLRRETLRQAQEAEARRQAEAERQDTGPDAARSALAEVGGLGEARIDALLEAFPTLATLRDADERDLVAIQGIGPALARKIASSVREGSSRR